MTARSHLLLAAFAALTLAPAAPALAGVPAGGDDGPPAAAKPGPSADDDAARSRNDADDSDDDDDQAANYTSGPGGADVTITNGPVPDTPRNRARYGGPDSNGGAYTAPEGD